MSAGRLGYNGSIQPAIWFSYSSVVGANLPPNADEWFNYVLANESAYEITLVAKTAAGDFKIGRKATSANRFFSDSLNTYTLSGIPAATLEAILDEQDAGTLKLFVTIKTWYKAFFLELIKYMTRQGSDTFNVANPEDPAPVEASFRYALSGSTATVTHTDKQHEIKDIPAVLDSYTVDPPTSPGRAPQVKLRVYLQLFEALSEDDCRAASEILLAADYSKIYKWGADRSTNWCQGAGNYRRSYSNAAAQGIEICLQVWEKNVANYLWNNTDLDRGERIFNEIVDAAEAEIAKPQLEVVQLVRDAIDARIVTANHWADRREDWVTERYQKKLSDLFGAIHQSKWRASPVSFLREFRRENLTPEEGAFLTMQYGVGHCGEHARVSYNVIKELMFRGHDAKFECVIHTGNANIDHAFVVGGIRVVKIIHTKYTKSTSPGAIGEDVDVWDLRAALAAAPGVDGFVLDPYLAPSAQARTAVNLLASLNAARRGARITDFLSFVEQHPELPAPPEETRPSVKNV